MTRGYKLGMAKRDFGIKHVVFFDTETDEKSVDMEYSGNGTPCLLKLRLGWLNYIEFDECQDIVNDLWYEFRSVDDFWGYLEDLHFKIRRDSLREKGQNDLSPIHVLAFNMDFDINVVDAVRQLKRRDWSVSTPMWNGNIYIWGTKYKDRRFVWLDLNNFIGGFHPLSNIAKALGMKKDDVDASRIADYSDEIVSKYCKQDVNITREYFLRWIRFLKEHNCGEFKYTLASQCLTAYRHKGGGQDIAIHRNPLISELEREAYHGGWTEIYYVGNPKTTVYKLDVNSFHPYIMANFELPYCINGGIREGVNPKRIISDLPFIIDADVYCPDRLIPIKDKDRGLIFPTGMFRAQFTSVEYNRLLEIGGRVFKVHRLLYYKQKMLFKDYIDEFYSEKLEYKALGNKVFADMSKYFMNSLEGKFAQRNDKFIQVGRVDHDGVGYEDIEYEGKRLIMRTFSGGQWISVGKKEGSYTFISISSFIRAHTRVLLSKWMEMIRNAGGKVYMTDTDSIFTDEIGYKILDLVGLIDDTELGKLSLEGVSDEVYFRNLKDYDFGDVSKTKGKKKSAVTKEDGSWTQTKFMRTRGMIQRGVQGGVVIIKDYMITPKREIRKGHLTSSGWVEPINLSLQQKLEV